MHLNKPSGSSRNTRLSEVGTRLESKCQQLAFSQSTWQAGKLIKYKLHSHPSKISKEQRWRGGWRKSEGKLRNNLDANWPNPNAFYGHKINSMARQDARFVSDDALLPFRAFWLKILCLIYWYTQLAIKIDGKNTFTHTQRMRAVP